MLIDIHPTHSSVTKLGDGFLRSEAARMSSQPASEYQPIPKRTVLHSWKEISGYARRGIRTIQRYESVLGFPIHRPAGTTRSAVLAFPDEIDVWLSSSPKRAAAPAIAVLRQRTVGQIRNQRQSSVAVANAKRNRQSAITAHEACERQAKLVEAMVAKFNAFRSTRGKELSRS